MIIEVKGDITNTDAPLIAHGVNCQNVMGSGVAKALYEKWPVVKWIYHDFFKEFNSGDQGEDFLGLIDYVCINRETGKPSPKYDLILVNCFTQQFYGYDGKLYLDYKALEVCLVKLKYLCKQHNIKEIAIPKIGCGLAGGDWEIVKNRIDLHLSDLTVRVYYK